MVLYETVRAPEPLYVEPEAPPAPPLLKVTFARLPPSVTPEMVFAVRRLVPIEVVATTEPFAFVERIAFVILVIAKLEVVALVNVVVPLKVLIPEKVLSVVVEKAVVKTPVDELYWSGKTAESDDEEILLLKRV